MPAARGPIEALARLYEFRDRVVVESLLREHPFLSDLLLEAHEEIGKLFGRNCGIALDVLTDDESDGEQQLFVLIRSQLDLKESLALLDALDRVWWLKALPAAQHRMTIDLECGACLTGQTT